MIYIFLPAYNEEKNIRRTIIDSTKVLRGLKYQFLVVNDGSVDRTTEVVNLLAKKLPVKIISHEINRGVAEALKTGIKEITRLSKNNGDILVIMEADGTSDSNILRAMIERVNNGDDIVIASRYLNNGRYVSFPLQRLMLSRLANLTFRLVFPNKLVRDYTIFYRAYSLDIIKKAIKRLGKNLVTTKYFTANTELLVKLLDITNRVSEVPFIYDYSIKRGKSGLKVGKNLLQYLKLIANRLFFL